MNACFRGLHPAHRIKPALCRQGLRFVALISYKRRACCDEIGTLYFINACQCNRHAGHINRPANSNIFNRFGLPRTSADYPERHNAKPGMGNHHRQRCSR